MTQPHSPKKIATLVPNYVTKFQCLGKECPDTCCAGWNVAIDRKTYKLYKSIDLKNLKEQLKNYVHRNRKNSTENDYAYIEMQGEDRSCPFLSDSLCSIQLNAGEQYLSNTCATFPRRTTHMEGATEQTLSLSCPEAARLALLDPEALQLTECNLVIRPDTIEKIDFSYPHFTNILVFARAAILNILKDHKYKIHELLAILILFLEEFDIKIKSKDDGDITILIEETLKNINSFSFPSFQPSSKYHLNQIQICLELFKFKSDFTTSKFFASIAQHACSGASLQESYVRGLDIIKRNSDVENIILRNYCAHEIFQSKIPCVAGASASQLGGIIVNFYLIKTVMAISLGSNTVHEVNNFAISLIKDFSKGYQHDSAFRSAIVELVSRMNWKSIERIHPLLLT